MNPLEIAKEAIRIASNAGLKKDVIDLLEKQIGLLAQEKLALKRKLELSETEAANLKRKVKDLEEQLKHMQPKGTRLDETSEKFLQLLSRVPTPSLEQMARELGMPQILAHRANVLRKKGMIELVGYIPHKGTVYALTGKGTAYVVENDLTCQAHQDGRSGKTQSNTIPESPFASDC
jgi:chromosome segregation ATPase